MLRSLIDSRKAFSTTQQTFIKTTERVSGSFVTMMKDYDLGDEKVDRDLEAREHAPEQPVQEPGAGVRLEVLQRRTRPRHGSVHLDEDRTLSLKEPSSERS